MKKMKKGKGYENTMPAKASLKLAKASGKTWPKFKRVF